MALFSLLDTTKFMYTEDFVGMKAKILLSRHIFYHIPKVRDMFKNRFSVKNTIF